MRYLALLRGINVGGNTMIKMEELRRTFEALGLGNVKSYINSGNLAFDAEAGGSPPPSSGSASGNEGNLALKLEAAIEKDFGKQVPVIIRQQKEDIERILAGNPFDGEFESHKEMHVLFLKEVMPPEKAVQLTAAAVPPERFVMKGREIYCHLPMGVADSLLGKSFIEKKLKVAVTGRNWRTVQKLAEL